MQNLPQIRRYTFKLYPTMEQAIILQEQCKMMADLWNALLHRHEDVYRRTRGQRGVIHAEEPARTPSFYDMTREITELRKMCPEWARLSVWSAYGVAEALDNAFKAFYRRAKQGAAAQSGYPQYKRRAAAYRIPHRHNLPLGARSGSGSGCRLLPAPRERSGDGKNPGSARNRNFALTVKGIDGPIHARGKFPIAPDKCTSADIIYRDGCWWFSVCVEMAARRRCGSDDTRIVMNLIDGFADVNGTTITPAALIHAQSLQDHVDHLKSERDMRWPKRAPADSDWSDANAEISRLSAKIARIRRDALHVWTARIVRDSADLTIITAPVKDSTQSPRGNAKAWGANVEPVSTLNRNILSQAPAAAVQMLKYKAAEAGIRCDVIEEQAPAIAVGAALVKSGRKLRRIKRKIRREINGEGISYTSGDQGRGVAS